MAILAAIMNVLKNIWLFVALLIVIYGIACVLLKKNFETKEYNKVEQVKA